MGCIDLSQGVPGRWANNGEVPLALCRPVVAWNEDWIMSDGPHLTAITNGNDNCAEVRQVHHTGELNGGDNRTPFCQ